MKTYEVVKGLKTGEKRVLGMSSIGNCQVRRTTKGVIVEISSGTWYVRNSNIRKTFRNLNTIGLQSNVAEYGTRHNQFNI
jgi:hypothetical protein